MSVKARPDDASIPRMLKPLLEGFDPERRALLFCRARLCALRASCLTGFCRRRGLQGHTRGGSFDAVSTNDS
jgi:hypothetical protein